MTEHVRCIFQTEQKKSIMIYDEEGWDQIRDTWMAQDEALKQIGHSESTAFSRIINAFLAGEQNQAFSPTTVLYALLLLGQMTEGECRREIYDALSFIEMGVAAACASQSVKKIDFILNRPFIFAITKACRIPMYIGMVVNPQEKESV